MNKHAFQNGFTLIEVLVALAIFAILATLSSAALYHSFQLRDRLATEATRLSEIQLALLTLDRDLQQAINKPDLFLGDPKHFSFTRENLSHIDNKKSKTFIRITYLCTQHALIRQETINGSIKDRLLLTELKTCNFAYLNKNQETITHWKNSLPTAVKLTLENAWGPASLMFIVPGGLYAE